MSQQPVIDGFEFAATGASLQGLWPLADFPRLRESLATPSGEVAYELHGVHDEHGRPSLRLQVRGTLPLRCQRCLEAMPFELHADETLVLAHSTAEIDAEPADVHAADRVVGGKEMAVRDLIEDELILGLPYAPRHEGCIARSATDEAKRSPFADLRSLMDGGGKH